MTDTIDLTVIGAGPAGMAAAAEAAGLGLSARVLDEQPAPGGQIYRAVEAVERERAGDLALLGEEYREGLRLAGALRSAGVDHRPGATVWQVETDPLSVGYTVDGEAAIVHARRVLACTGACERPVPIPGWTLPGVMSAGAMQILLKASGSVPAGRVVVAGSGPLALLVTVQLAEAGADVIALLESTTFGDFLDALPALPGALRASGHLAKGRAYRRRLHAAGVPVAGGVRGLAARGDGRVETVHYVAGGRRQQLACDVLLLHEGVVPNTQLTRQIGAGHEWHERQRYWRPRLDEWGNTTVAGVAVAGDGGGIDGAGAAEAAGHLAALEAARAIGRIDAAERDRRAAPWRSRQSRERAIRPLLDRLFPPCPEALVPPDDATLVCRCEEVSAGEIRRCVELGCIGPNQTKAYTRCGMGPCQGRMCGLPVAEIIAAARGVSPAEVGYYRVRPPIKPITLGELAGLDLPGDVIAK